MINWYKLINRGYSLFFPIWDKLVWQSYQHTKLLASTLAGPAWRCWELRSVLWLPSSGVSAQCDANVSVACLKRIHASLLQVHSPICLDTYWHSICSWVFQTFYISILLLWSNIFDCFNVFQALQKLRHQPDNLHGNGYYFCSAVPKERLSSDVSFCKRPHWGTELSISPSYPNQANQAKQANQVQSKFHVCWTCWALTNNGCLPIKLCCWISETIIGSSRWCTVRTAECSRSVIKDFAPEGRILSAASWHLTVQVNEAPQVASQKDVAGSG